MATSSSTLSWEELSRNYLTNRIPPRWAVGSDKTYEQWKKDIKDWRVMSESSRTDKQRTIAAKFRLRATAKQVAEEAPKPEPVSLPTGPDGALEVTEPVGSQFRMKLIEELDRKFGEQLDNLARGRFDRFFEFFRKAGVLVREVIAESGTLYTWPARASRSWTTSAAPTSFWPKEGSPGTRWTGCSET